MTFNLLDNSPEAAEKLVSLHDKQRLYMLAHSDDVEAREELAGIMADLLAIDLKDSEIELITDVLLNLVSKAEKDLRAAIAERVAAMPQLPLRMALSFVNDDIEVASPILRMAKVLNDMDLIYIIKSQTTEYWQEIAKRENMSAVIVDILADTNDEETARVLIENETAQLTYHSMNVFSDMSENSEALAASLLTREDIPETLIQKVYGFVGEELKEKIKNEYAIAEAKQLVDVIEDITFELVEREGVKEEPTGDMIVAAEMMMKKGALSPHVMVQNLKRGQLKNFIAMFSVYAGISSETFAEMLSQDNGQGLAIACKALSVLKPDFINIYLLTAKMRDSLMIKQDQLNRALNYFDAIEVAEAKSILNKSRH